MPAIFENFMRHYKALNRDSQAARGFAPTKLQVEELTRRHVAPMASGRAADAVENNRRDMAMDAIKTSGDRFDSSMGLKRDALGFQSDRQDKANRINRTWGLGLSGVAAAGDIVTGIQQKNRDDEYQALLKKVISEISSRRR